MQPLRLTGVEATIVFDNRENLMKALVSSLAAAGLLAISFGGQAEAQDRVLRRATAGEPAVLNKAMTQAQARKICRQQMRGARESRSAIRQKMTFCVNNLVQGN